jgi:spore germination protein KC
MFLISCTVTTGCWDRVELNDRAILLGWGMDLTKDGRYLATANIVIPGSSRSSGTDGDENSFLIESAYGKSVLDASQNMQKKLSRILFPGHRRNIFIGEELAKHGLAEVLDEYVRNPMARMRTNLFVVKGDSAQRAMSMTYKLERNPAVAVQKIQEKLGVAEARSLLDFFIMLNGEGMPVVPSIKIVHPIKPPNGEPGKPHAPTEIAQFDGTAIFGRDLKLRGYIGYQDYWVRLWTTQGLSGSFFFIKMQDNQNVVVRAERLKSKIIPNLRSDPFRFHIKLKGIAAVLENNTHLDVGKPENARKIEQVFKRQVEEQVEKVIKNTQKQLGTDIFGLGRSIHHQYPYQWKKIKPVWDEEFVRAQVTVQVDVSIISTGVEGPSLIPKPDPEDRRES